MSNFILNKGGAGVSITREETISRLDPIIRAHSRLNHVHAAAVRTLSHEDIASEVETLLRKSRVDVAKLSETVLSAGGAPYNATDLEPENFVLEGSDAEVLEAARENEAEFQELVKGELNVRHHIRTQAILLNVQTNSQARLNYLDDAIQKVGQHV